MKPNAHPRLGGFTLLEVAITTTLLSLVLLGVFSLSQAGNDAFGSANLTNRTETRLQRAMHRIGRELANAGGDVLIPDPVTDYGASDLTFRTVAGSNEGAVVWSAPQRIAWRPESADPEDGVDNDGDGLIDEGEVVLIRNAGTANELTAVLCGGVPLWGEGEVFDGDDDNGNDVIDERGFNVHRVGRLLILRLTLSATDSEGRIVTRSETTGIRLRN